MVQKSKKSSNKQNFKIIISSNGLNNSGAKNITAWNNYIVSKIIQHIKHRR